jgi:hypothetical protein
MRELWEDRRLRVGNIALLSTYRSWSDGEPTYRQIHLFTDLLVSATLNVTVEEECQTAYSGAGCCSCLEAVILRLVLANGRLSVRLKLEGNWRDKAL